MTAEPERIHKVVGLASRDTIVDVPGLGDLVLERRQVLPQNRDIWQYQFIQVE